MTTFQVNDMTCGHCVSTITRAVQALDPQATVRADLAQHLVHVDAPAAQPGALADAIREAGYTALPVQPAAAAPTAARSGGGCGCG